MKKFLPMYISVLLSASIGITKPITLFSKFMKQKKSARSALFLFWVEQTILTVKCFCTTYNLEDFVGNSRLTRFIVAQFEVFL